MSIVSKVEPYVLAAKGYVKSWFSRYEDDGVTTGDVDFVVTWVDGNDPAWQAEKSRYDGSTPGNGACRYRDWVTFKYWFRAVEKYAPWVRHVYLVTWGHVPAWLNRDCPKLKIINHTDFIPSEYIPTFNSNPIELNLHRIPGLSEHFVYFNDDVLVSAPLKKTDLFINGLPRYPALTVPLLSFGNMVSYHIFFSQYSEINGHNDIQAAMKAYPEKWFHYFYGRSSLHNVTSYKSNAFLGMYFSHVGVPFRKSTFEKVWKKYASVAETATHKFRTPMDVSHFLVTADELLSGDFIPISPKGNGRSINLDDFECIRRTFMEKQQRMVCFNDSNDYSDTQVEQINQTLEQMLNTIFPEKSSFER